MSDHEQPAAYIECLAAQEAAYWEARRQGMNLTDRQVGDLLRAAAPHIRAQKHEDEALWRLATIMALTMPMGSPAEAALRDRVEAKQTEWERVLGPVCARLARGEADDE